MYKYIYSFIFLISLNPSHSQDIGFKEIKNIETYEAALNLAQENHKLLLVAITSKNDDQWEKLQSQNYFSQIGINQALKPYTLLHFNIESEMGARWVQIFELDSLPTFFFLQSDEFLLETIKGYPTTHILVKTADKVSSQKDIYQSLIDKHSNNTLNTQEWLQLIHLHSINFEFSQTMDIAVGFLNSLDDNQLSQAEILPLMIEYGLDLQTKFPKKVIQNQKAIQAKVTTFSFENYYKHLYDFNIEMALASNDSIFLEKIISDVVSVCPNPEVSKSKLAYETRMLFAVENNNFNMWIKASIAFAQQQATDSLKAEALFNDAFDIADQYNSEDAKKAAMLLAQKASTYNETFRYRMLEAYMAYLLKDYTTAKQLVQKASTLSNHPNNIRKANGLLQMINNEKP